MAARKSCTHMTWAEAKSKSGVSKSKAVKVPAQKESHGKLLAAKIVAKQGPSQSEQIKDRQAARLARRDQQRQEQLDARREAEKEQQRLNAKAKPHEQCLAKLAELAAEYKAKKITKSEEDATKVPDADLSVVCESKQLQYDEILALQAIYDDEETLTIADATALEDLQQKLDDWQMDPDQESLQSKVSSHPPLSFTLKKSIDDTADNDWVAHLLLLVRFQDDYPTQQSPPIIEVPWFTLTQKSLVVADNKPLESLGHLDESRLQTALGEQGQELIGMPRVYELLDTWLSENIFEFIKRD